MISIFELFKVGIGPSSSHTVGPMKAAVAFVEALNHAKYAAQIAHVKVDLLGSLAWTGKGHGTDDAVMLGLAGHHPETIDPDAAQRIVTAMKQEKKLTLGGKRTIPFDAAQHIVFDTVSPTPVHPNTLAFTAFDKDGVLLVTERWCSVGGGFVTREDEADNPPTGAVTVPFPFNNAAELLQRGRETGLTIDELVFANEKAVRPAGEITAYMDLISSTMMRCIDRGLATDGQLPGGLQVKRRAKALHGHYLAAQHRNIRHPHEVMDLVSMFAIAVNEENAAGGRVVTAPTNGAAGVIPAVLRYYREHCTGATDAGVRAFLLAATAIGALFKMNASISGAEVGCQGEIGSACAMAAGGLAAALGGSNEQIENAAEIGMEHHLGMTCDPVGGLVQIPCIERNAFGAVKAINAASLALHGDGIHRVSLDQVIATMYQTGSDMHSKYKETSQGGLAVNFTAC
jgi:L-serine dehydratase